MAKKKSEVILPSKSKKGRTDLKKKLADKLTKKTAKKSNMNLSSKTYCRTNLQPKPRFRTFCHKIFSASVKFFLNSFAFPNMKFRFISY